jgi:hypothetical protein
MNETRLSIFDKDGAEYRLHRLSLEELIAFERRFNCSLAESAQNLSWMTASAIVAAALDIAHEKVLSDFDCATLAQAVNTIFSAYALPKPA